MDKLDSLLTEYLVKKAPALPTKAKEVIVQFAPYLVILVIVMGIPAIFALLGLGTYMSAVPFGAVAMASVGYYYYIGIIFLAITMVLEVIALPGLFSKSQKAWKLLFYSTLINSVYALVRMNIGSLIIGTLISLYVLYQVKSYYK
jgi:hypothetical protein